MSARPEAGSYRFGPELLGAGRSHFRLFAPARHAVSVVLDEGPAQRVLPMSCDAAGWHEASSDDCPPGTRYAFLLDDGLVVPDPASRHQPRGVHGPSELIDHGAYVWRDQSWRGRRWHEAVVCELHVGCYTTEGSFAALETRLDHIATCGITAIELMPVAGFPGRRGWGYDGVLLYAPFEGYGRPDDLKRLVDAAHARGLMVLLDVVYNHFGPEGNYMPGYWPQLMNAAHTTPWGAAVNYDAAGSREVREFVIENAIYWLREFHLDGLRFDAVHAIRDDGNPPLLEELAARIRAAVKGREIHLVLENEENDARWLERAADGSPLHYTAQWNDDLHHGLHVALTAEDAGYYVDYARQPQLLTTALAQGFGFQGQHMSWRDSPRGTPSAHLPPTAFVGFLQNHDQIGNRALGERLNALAPPAALLAASAVLLLAPQIPLLFMGEEWGCTRPFLFFCDLGPELADSIRDGRRREFAGFPAFKDPVQRERIPDPTAWQTFADSRLDWQEPAQPAHAQMLDRTRRLLAVRQAEIVPLLKEGATLRSEVLAAGLALRVRWSGRDTVLSLEANLTAEAVNMPRTAGRTLWQEGSYDDSTSCWRPWSVRWSVCDI